MPYDIRKMGSKYCVVKRDGGKKMGCHPNRAKAVRQLRAIMASESKEFHPAAVFKLDGRRHMLLVSTNGYKDREGEYVSQYAMRDEINRQWTDDGFHGDNVLKFWHGGPAIGDIVWADQDGAFTIEVARERESGLPVVKAYTEAIWNYLEQGPDAPYGASIGFAFRPTDKAESTDGPIYRNIRKFETSVLPLEHAANPYTFAGVLDMSNARDKELEKITGRTGLWDNIKRVLSGETEALASDGKEAKQFTGKTTITRQDMVDMVEFGVKSVLEKAGELAAETKDDDTTATMDMDTIIGDVVDTFLEVPTVDLETAADILAVNDADAPEAEQAEGEDAHAHADSGEHAADGELIAATGLMNDKALEVVIEMNKALTTENAEIVKALQAVVPELAKLAGLSEQVTALKAQVASLNDEFKHRPRASIAQETVDAKASEMVQKLLDADKADDDHFFPKAPKNGA